MFLQAAASIFVVAVRCFQLRWTELTAALSVAAASFWAPPRTSRTPGRGRGWGPRAPRSSRALSAAGSIEEAPPTQGARSLVGARSRQQGSGDRRRSGRPWEPRTRAGGPGGTGRVRAAPSRAKGRSRHVGALEPSGGCSGSPRGRRPGPPTRHPLPGSVPAGSLARKRPRKEGTRFTQPPAPPWGLSPGDRPAVSAPGLGRIPFGWRGGPRKTRGPLSTCTLH